MHPASGSESAPNYPMEREGARRTAGARRPSGGTGAFWKYEAVRVSIDKPGPNHPEEGIRPYFGAVELVRVVWY